MKSKKIIVVAVVLVIFLLAGILWNIYQKQKDIDIEHYCYTVNQHIKDFNFSYAEISDGAISLYTDTGKLIEKISFSEYNKSLNILSVRKEENSVFFILNKSVDDEVGIMFINDDSANILDGMNSIERIGGNYFRYDTSR